MTDAVRRARGAAALAFATQGMVFISLTTRLPRFSDRWHLSEVELSLVLLMIVLLAGVGSVVAELVARRIDSASTLRAGQQDDHQQHQGQLDVGEVPAVREPRQPRREADEDHALGSEGECGGRSGPPYGVGHGPIVPVTPQAP